MILGTFSVARGIASIIGPSLGTALYSPKEAEERFVLFRLPSSLPPPSFLPRPCSSLLSPLLSPPS